MPDDKKTRDELGMPNKQKAKKSQVISKKSRRGSHKKRRSSVIKSANNNKINTGNSYSFKGTKGKSKKVKGNKKPRVKNTTKVSNNIDNTADKPKQNFNQSKLKKEYEKATNRIRQMISKARKQGYDIKYKLTRPSKITQEDIDYLRSLKLNDIKKGVMAIGVNVQSTFVGEDVDMRPKHRVYQRDILKPKDEPETQEEINARIDALYDEQEVAVNFPFTEKPVAYRDEFTGKVFDPEESYVYETKIAKVNGKLTEQFIYDEEGNAKPKSNMTPIMGGTMDRADYEDLIRSNIEARYLGGVETINENALTGNRKDNYNSTIQKWIDEYGVFEVRDMLQQAEDEGLPVHYYELYLLSPREYEQLISQLQLMLATGKATKEDMLAMSEAVDGMGTDFNIDYKNG